MIALREAIHWRSASAPYLWQQHNEHRIFIPAHLSHRLEFVQLSRVFSRSYASSFLILAGSMLIWLLMGKCVPNGNSCYSRHWFVTATAFNLMPVVEKLRINVRRIVCGLLRQRATPWRRVAQYTATGRWLLCGTVIFALLSTLCTRPQALHAWILRWHCSRIC